MSEIPHSANQSLSNLLSEELVEFPLVTVNILSFNRKEELRHTLTKVYEQDYKNIEVIVVDNASSDGSAEMVEQEFPSVILIKLQKNIGIAGWNRGFEIAKGEFVLVLDDDSYPEEGCIKISIVEIVKDKNIGILSCSIFNTSYNSFETYDYSIENEYRFIGCGAIIRKDIFGKCGYFLDEIFIYVHEIEFCMRVLNNGYLVKFSPGAIVIHNQHKLNREFNDRARLDLRKLFYSSKNILLILFLHFPLKLVFFRMLRIIFGRIVYGIRTQTLSIIIRAIREFVSQAVMLKNSRVLLLPSILSIFMNGAFAGGFFFRIDNNLLQTRNDFSWIFKN